MTAKIIEEEQLAKDYNIYIFHGTDGDDWEYKGEKTISAIKQMLPAINRLGITVAKNSWGTSQKKTTVEQYIDNSGLLKEKASLIKLDSMVAANATEERIIEGIKKLLS